MIQFRIVFYADRPYLFPRRQQRVGDAASHLFGNGRSQQPTPDAA